MENNEFNFYNSENDGYRGSFGDYTDPIPTTGGPVEPGKGPKKKKTGLRIAALLLACVVLGGGAGVGGAALYAQMNQPETVVYEGERPQVQTVVNNNNGEPMTAEQLYAANLASCVGITVNTTVNIFGQTTTSAASGSGFVLTQDGYIVTNAHVVAGADSVNVAFSDNQVLPASLVGFDAEEDLAVLKVDAQGLTPAEFGDSSQLHVGDPVAAIGDPLGYRSTITDGIISSLDREVDVEGVTMVLIQTSAAINFGNSGGALINQYGQVVGITTIKIVTDDGSAESLGFAIPSRRVKYVVDSLIAGEEVGTGVFGFTVSTKALDGGGLEIISVDKASDAAAKGIQAGDIILAANGQTVTTTQDLARLKLSMGPGDLITLTIRRGEETFTVEVALVDESLIDQGGLLG